MGRGDDPFLRNESTTAKFRRDLHAANEQQWSKELVISQGDLSTIPYSGLRENVGAISEVRHQAGQNKDEALILHESAIELVSSRIIQESLIFARIKATLLQLVRSINHFLSSSLSEEIAVPGARDHRAEFHWGQIEWPYYQVSVDIQKTIDTQKMDGSRWSQFER